ncbi:MAG: hypothetical protein A2998_02255 [Candidatus Staskawiczbacteria bacterium RIFCSPLOWO2_01_FULL_37_25b]|uniref:Uncharacterized protein n=2 Tax=Candidatus Staskawicziibacteriota TaxID=1817916 RepID=A0A1G2HTI0_9BACT|nr:MAG: hypothetical protein A2812_01240 [Candidatus Staskawiczbacteria bacterium RIFCSPHIGHO2_01_FULL_36_16]OGZ74720.1 MAG: hypothetical protein A2998_02255 [Candidatus Staskawiczbacteria bacterium RIFCSPLOWO2_01_FULL_37_25b]
MSAHINQECLLDAQGAVDQFDRLPPFISRKYNFDNLQLAQLADKNRQAVLSRNFTSWFTEKEL